MYNSFDYNFDNNMNYEDILGIVTYCSRFNELERSILLLNSSISNTIKYSKALILEILNVYGNLEFKQRVLFDNLFQRFYKLITKELKNCKKSFDTLKNTRDFEFKEKYRNQIRESLEYLDLFDYLVLSYKEVFIDKRMEDYSHGSLSSEIKVFKKRLLNCLEKLFENIDYMLKKRALNVSEYRFNGFLDRCSSQILTRYNLINLLNEQLDWINRKLFDEFLPLKNDSLIILIHQTSYKRLYRIGKYFVIVSNYEKDKLVNLFDREGKLGYLIAHFMQYEITKILEEEIKHDLHCFSEIIEIITFYNKLNLSNDSKEHIYVIDLETTGTDFDDVIIEIAICDLNLTNGKIIKLLNMKVKDEEFNDEHIDSWIFDNSDLTYKQIDEAKSTDLILPYLQCIFNKYETTSFVIEFDFQYIKNLGIKPLSIGKCIMLTSKYILNIPHSYHGIKYPKLSEAYNHFFPESNNYTTHNAMQDCFESTEILYEMYKLGKWDLKENLLKKKQEKENVAKMAMEKD
jgi:hypothetical protein